MNWYGKGCNNQRNQWEENETTGGPDYKEAEPTLFYCVHDRNPKDHEGNCRKEICPVGWTEQKE